ncbi:sensor histidine kinase [Nocardiopsis sediminis]|uniref:histidine kinase n=1 Tax=Nocardiopsis sediminis TaxID=1778267 RepID=A0ABV8FUT2_9ACTN
MHTDRPTWRSRAWGVAFALLALLALTLATAGIGDPTPVGAVLAVTAATTALVIAGAVARSRAQRRRYEDELAAWAAEGAAQAERLRIARDLHDLASHGLGLITVRAAAARSVTGPGGDAERAGALADIEDTSRQTTTELRRMLTVLRTPGPAPLRPPDTLDDLPAIVRAANATGLAATLDAGEVGDVSPGVQLAVCAVVREALNNTLRHAGPTRASVRVRRDGDTIAVDVRDAGPGSGRRAHPGAGHGISGLHERVAALGGTLHAAPAGDGWSLAARIPEGGRP